MKHQYQISGMHCGSCASKITEALEGLDPIQRAQVTLDPPRAVVTMEDHLSLDRLQEAVSQRGDYILSPINDADEDDSSPGGDPTPDSFPGGSSSGARGRRTVSRPRVCTRCC